MASVDELRELIAGYDVGYDAAGTMTHRVAVGLNGWRWTLPTAYSMAATDLAELLNAYRAASVLAGPGDWGVADNES
jgi:hypothetical protein